MRARTVASKAISVEMLHAPALRPLLGRAGAACAVGLVLGTAGAILPPLLSLAIPVAALGLVLVIRRPEIALLGVVVATASIVFEETLPLIPIGVGSLHLPDFVLLTLLGIIIVRALVEPGFRIVASPLNAPLIVFYGATVLSTGFALAQGSVDFNMALRELRVVTYYLLFFIVTNLVRERKQITTLLHGLFFIGTVVAAAMIAQFLVGDTIHLLPRRVETLGTQGTVYSGVTRILPPGQSLVLVGFMALTVTLVLDKFRPGNLLKLVRWALFGLAVVITFNRSFWVGVLLALVILAILIKGRDRHRFMALALTLLFVGTFVVLVTVDQTDSQIGKLVSASLARLGTLASGDTLAEDSLQQRYFENDYAVAQIVSHPLLGLGMGALYRPFVPPWDHKNFDGRNYIHNGHLWILMKAGLAGYLGLAWLSIAFLVRGFRRWRSIPDPELRGAVLGFTLSYLGVLVGSLVAPMFMQWFWTTVIGLMMGINEAILVGTEREAGAQPLLVKPIQDTGVATVRIRGTA